MERLLCLEVEADRVHEGRPVVAVVDLRVLVLTGEQICLRPDHRVVVVHDLPNLRVVVDDARALRVLPRSVQPQAGRLGLAEGHDRQSPGEVVENGLVVAPAEVHRVAVEETLAYPAILLLHRPPDLVRASLLQDARVADEGEIRARRVSAPAICVVVGDTILHELHIGRQLVELALQVIVVEIELELREHAGQQPRIARRAR